MFTVLFSLCFQLSPSLSYYCGVWQTDAEIESLPEKQQNKGVYDDRPLFEVGALFHCPSSGAVSLSETLLIA